MKQKNHTGDTDLITFDGLKGLVSQVLWLGLPIIGREVTFARAVVELVIALRVGFSLFGFAVGSPIRGSLVGSSLVGGGLVHVVLEHGVIRSVGVRPIQTRTTLGRSRVGWVRVFVGLFVVVVGIKIAEGVLEKEFGPPMVGEPPHLGPSIFNLWA